MTGTEIKFYDRTFKYLLVKIFRKKLPTGTEIKFYDRTFKGEEYKDLSEDKVRFSSNFI